MMAKPVIQNDDLLKSVVLDEARKRVATKNIKKIYT